MNPARHARAKEIFLEACELEDGARDAHLAEACGGDAELLAAVRELLASDAEPHAWLAAADRGGAARWLERELVESADAGEGVPERIGAYRIVRLLGRGGMGVVYEAEQENPRRRVAVKVLSVGLGSPAHLQRFRQEAELLGRLHHAGIAHVYEAGTAEIRGEKQPFFAMELVEGASLLVHAERARLDLAARLELFTQVCEAVQHAHESGILHRDLKPSNIVVDGAGRAKVLDFGVARLLERTGDAHPSDDAHHSTVTGLVVGTLATMSPEQVSANSGWLDSRSDVYSLGVVAYELVTGRLPLEVSGLSLPAAARLICEEDPPLAGTLDRRLRGDPETILAKALSKERTQRYGSARELAADVRRYLQREPIHARPASTFYHLRMLARRNRALVAGLAVAALALVIGAGVSAWFAWRESRLRELADQSRARAEREAYRGNVVAAGLALERYNRAYASTLLAGIERLGRGWEFRRIQRGTEPWISAREVDVGHAWQAGLLGDGSRAVVVGQNGAVVVLDVETGAHELELGPSPARTDPVALATDACCVLSVQEDELVLWDARTGDERRRVRAPARLLPEPRYSAALARDEKHAVVSVRGGAMLLVDLDTGGVRELFPFAVPVAFDAEGRQVATASPTETAIWSVADGSRRQSLARVADARAIAFDPAGTRLAVAGEHGVRVFDVRGGNAMHAEGPPEEPTALAYSPDGRLLAGMQDDGSLLIWDEDGRLVERFPVGRHSWKTSLAWGADGESLLTAAHTNPVVRLWSLREGRRGEVLRGHTSYVYPVACSPDGRRIVSGGWDDRVRIWNAATGACLATLASAARVQALAIAPDGNELVAATGGGALIAWDTRTGAELARTQPRGTGWACCARWSPDGATLAASFDIEHGQIRLLEPTTLETRAVLEDPPSAITTLAFDPGGSLLAAGNVGGEIVVWDLGAQTIRARAKGLPVPHSVCFSPDGARLAVAGDGSLLALFDAHTLDGRQNLTGHQGEVFSAAFSPDGSRLFSGGRDGLLRVWDPGTGDLLGEFGGHRDYIWCLAVSPDGARVITGSGDFDVRQWQSEPVAVTEQRRREAEELALQAGPLVAGLLSELGKPAAVAERLEHDPALTDGLRAAAFDELLRRASGAR